MSVDNSELVAYATCPGTVALAIAERLVAMNVSPVALHQVSDKLWEVTIQHDPSNPSLLHDLYRSVTQ